MSTTITVPLNEEEVANLARWEQLVLGSSGSSGVGGVSLDTSRSKVCQVILSYAVAKIDEVADVEGDVVALRRLIDGPLPPGMSKSFVETSGSGEAQIQVSEDMAKRLTERGAALVGDGQRTARAILRHAVGVYLHFGIFKLYDEPIAEVTELFVHELKSRRGRRPAAA